MDHITTIMDMDGFHINGNFLCKELAIIGVRSGQILSYFFDIGYDRYDMLSPKDQKSCHYVTRYIHGLPLGVPPHIQALPLNTLHSVVRFCQRWFGNGIMAFKGGNHEKKL